MSRTRGLLAGMAVCALLFSSVAMAAQDADVAGNWELEFTIPMGQGRTITGTLTLEVDGQDLKGTFLREGGGGGKGAMQVTFEGTVGGGAMSGELNIGDRASGDWTAERAG